MVPVPWAYAHGAGTMGICSWCRHHGHVTVAMGICTCGRDQEQMTPKCEPEIASGPWILTGQSRTSEKCSKINEYGTPRAESSSKSISEQFPMDRDTSQLPKSNQNYSKRAQRPRHAPTRVFCPTPNPKTRRPSFSKVQDSGLETCTV